MQETCAMCEYLYLKKKKKEFTNAQIQSMKQWSHMFWPYLMKFGLKSTHKINKIKSYIENAYLNWQR